MGFLKLRLEHILKLCLLITFVTSVRMANTKLQRSLSKSFNWYLQYNYDMWLEWTIIPCWPFSLMEPVIEFTWLYMTVTWLEGLKWSMWYWIQKKNRFPITLQENQAQLVCSRFYLFQLFFICLEIELYLISVLFRKGWTMLLGI